MEKDMGNNIGNKSLLVADRIEITDKLYVYIPTVGEVLQDERNYYNLVSTFTASPNQYMVQLDDAGIDYTKISDYELFLSLFPSQVKSNDTRYLFGDTDLSDAVIGTVSDGIPFVYCQSSDVIIDMPAYIKLADALRKLNLLKKDTTKPGNEYARKYLIDKERRRQKRLAKKPHEPYLENLVIALVNATEFPYDYDSCMDLSIYRFNKSLEQIQRKINFDNLMHGVYAGTVDSKKIDKKDLSWFST